MTSVDSRGYQLFEIANTLSKYAWGYDEADFDLLADAFTSDAVVEGRVKKSTQGWGPIVGREEIVSCLRDIRADQHDSRRHNITNLLVEELTERTAKVRCNFILCATPEGGSPRIVATGLYRCEMIKEENVWRMQKQDALLDSGF